MINILPSKIVYKRTFGGLGSNSAANLYDDFTRSKIEGRLEKRPTGRVFFLSLEHNEPVFYIEKCTNEYIQSFDNANVTKNAF